MIDWLGSRYGRLAAFFLLYVTEGIPLGYTATFVATLMRREGVTPEVIGTFVAALYLPWSFNWAAGPFVDLFRSKRLGPRRAWIVGTQFIMTASLMSLAALNLLKGVTVADVTLFTAVVVVSNIFGAIQDVAIDALAVDTLHESERGLANGLMFAGAAVGQAVGGSGALYLLKYLDFWGATLFVGGSLMLVLVFVSFMLKERVDPARQILTGDVGDQIVNYLVTAKQAFFGSKLGLLGLVLALLPAGGHALGLTLQSNLAVELGLSDDQVATLNLVSTLAFAVFCAGGGWISDYFGRLRSLSIFIVLTVIPTLALAWLLRDAGWIMPVNPTLPNRPTPPEWLVAAFWAATIVFNMANGLMYGTRSAFFMDFCDPKVAATQFTAYMALMNLVISYTAYWQGHAINALGYPITLVLDAAAGLVCLAALAVVPTARRADGWRSGILRPAPEDERCPVCGRDLAPDDVECRACGEPIRAG
jgi:PAT family beta-lactamase induction signal transducer AmpG